MTGVIYDSKKGTYHAFDGIAIDLLMMVNSGLNQAFNSRQSGKSDGVRIN